ncbi:hypothetical protein Tco_1467133 [Tanacetum coccineum]
MMQGASFTQGTVSSIAIGGNISPGGFSPSILLVVILVTVVIVAVVLVVVVIGVVIVVAIIGIVFIVGGVSFIIKLSFVIIGFLLRIKSEDIGGIIPSLESFEELKEVLPDEAEWHGGL